jgi:hypothetical protein
MRLVVLVVPILAGCPVQGDECDEDFECEAGFVCARDHACLLPEEVRATTTTWTINGGPANTVVCDNHDLFIRFENSANPQDDLGFRPVPCFTGQFVVDKLPVRFDNVELGVVDDGDRATSSFDGNGVATFDLGI